MALIQAAAPLQTTVKRREPWVTPRQLEIHSATYFDRSALKAIQVTGGIRAGKSLMTADFAFSWHLWADLIWIQGPDYEQARHEMRYIFDLLDAIGNIESASMPNAPAPWVIKTKTGCEFATKSSSDPEKLAGRAPDIVCMVEAGQQPNEAMQRAIERLIQKDGILFMNGTLEESQPWYAELYQRWQAENDERGRSFNLPTVSNIFDFPLGERDPKYLRAVASLPNDVVKARFWGIPLKPAGLVHPEYSALVHSNLDKWPVSYQDLLDRIKSNSLPITLWIDPGFSGGYSVLWACIVGNDAYVLDEKFDQGKDSQDMVMSCSTHPLWKYVNYAVMDIAGRQKNANSKVSAKEWWTKEGRVTVKDQTVGISDGIVRVRSFLKVDPLSSLPHLFIHPQCKNFVWELASGYRYPLDSESRAINSERPIDRNNHASKACAYGLVEAFGFANGRAAYGAVKRSIPFWRRGIASIGDTDES